MRLFRFGLWIVVLLGATACVRTLITHGMVTKSGGFPYSKMLVCSMTGDRTQAARIESVLAAKLRRHRVDAQTCTDLVYPTREHPVNEAITAIQSKRFDGVLVTQRVLGGPAVSDSPAPFSNLRDFVEHYAAKQKAMTPAAMQQELDTSLTTVTSIGKERAGRARADLIGVREDQTVWSTGGIVVGGLHRPIEEFLQSFASSIESGLEENGVLPTPKK